jgi:Yip1-like protein
MRENTPDQGGKLGDTMDFNKLIERVKNILITPKTTWPVIAEEPATTKGIYMGYVLILAAIPALFGFIDSTLMGTRIPFGGVMRLGVGTALAVAILTYVLSIVGVFIAALIVDALAPNFGGQKNSVQALKAVAYAYTASWIAGIGAIVPFLSWLIAIAGFVYSIYLLYLGLPPNMKVTQEKAAGYTAVVVVIAIVVGWITSLVAGGVMGAGLLARGVFSGSSPSSSSDVKFDPDSRLGKLQQWGEQMEKAGQKMEAAQKSGDSKAQGEAIGGMLSAALGGGKFESLPTDRMKSLLPESLAGLPRKSISAERNNAFGMQVSKSEAQYGGENGAPLTVEITDVGGAQGIMMLAGWASIEEDKESGSGYEKTYHQNGRMVHEQWDNSSQSGQYSVILGERFIAEVRGHAASMDQLKGALAGLDLAAIEALKNEGRKSE